MVAAPSGRLTSTTPDRQLLHHLRAERGAKLNADPADQQRLLELADRDTRLAQIAHKLATLPQTQRLAEIDARAVQVRDQLVAAQVIADDLKRDLNRAEADVAQVVERARHDRELMDSGSIGDPKQLQSLEHELTSLARRQSDLEDVELEVMDRVDGANAAVAQLTAEGAALAAEREDAAAQEAAARGELDSERAAVAAERAQIVAIVPADLLALYERIGAEHGGVGAAHLHRGRCEGCHLTLTPADIQTIKQAADNEVVRCEECRRILVRTTESGLHA